MYIAVYVFVGLSGTRHDIIARALLFPYQYFNGWLRSGLLRTLETFEQIFIRLFQVCSSCCNLRAASIGFLRMPSGAFLITLFSVCALNDSLSMLNVSRRNSDAHICLLFRELKIVAS